MSVIPAAPPAPSRPVLPPTAEQVVMLRAIRSDPSVSVLMNTTPSPAMTVAQALVKPPCTALALYAGKGTAAVVRLPVRVCGPPAPVRSRCATRAGSTPTALTLRTHP